MAHLVMMLILLVITIVILRLTLKRVSPTLDSFIVANRRVPFIVGIASLTANWIQAPAILASGMFAYLSPYHFGVFFAANVAAMILGGLVAPRIRRAIPRGFNINQFLGHEYGPGVRSLCLISSFGAISLVIAYTCTGMVQWARQDFGVSAPETAIALSIFACILVIPRGTEGAIYGDVLKASIMLLGVIGACALIAFAQPRIPSPSAAQTSVNGMWVLWAFGIPLAASLLGGPLANPDLSGKLFAVEEKNVQRAYWGSAILCALMVAIFGALGFYARSLNVLVGADQFPAFVMLQASTSQAVVSVVTFGLLLILALSLASFLTGAGDIMSIEIYRRFIKPDASDAETIRWDRLFMIAPLLIGTYLASLEKIDLALLLQSMAVFRGQLIFPIIIAAFSTRKDLSEYIFWGMAIATIGGSTLTFLPIPELGAHGKPLGALFAVFVPLIAWIVGLVVKRPKALLA